MRKLFERLVRKKWLRKLGVAVAVVTVLVVMPILAFSQATIESIVNGWLSQCIAVVDVSQKGSEAPIVRIYSFGKMPESLPLTFSVERGLIQRISLLNHVEQETTAIESNLLVHPLANQRCPGDLCPETNEPSEKLTIRIKPISPNYVYQLRVLFTEPDPVNRLKVYVKPLIDEKIVCRIERAC